MNLQMKLVEYKLCSFVREMGADVSMNDIDTVHQAKIPDQRL